MDKRLAKGQLWQHADKGTMSQIKPFGHFAVLGQGNSYDECTVDVSTLSHSRKPVHDGPESVDACVAAGRCVKDCSGYGNVCLQAAQRAAKYTCKEVLEMKERSPIFSKLEGNGCGFHYVNQEDIKIGDILGEGGFSCVNLCTMEDGDGKSQQYAIKYLKRQVMAEPNQFRHGAADLATEAHFLHVLQHPNIVALHGVSPGPIGQAIASGKSRAFFIVIDKLVETLEERIDRWRLQSERSPKLFLNMAEHRNRKRQELHNRIQIASSIAVAMEYLHSLNILFRDLKGDNIGFDSDGVLKLFDFGLAKELKPGMKKEDGYYVLTGNTGSRRYMSPEVAKGYPYDTSVDIYSFGILLWELCSLEKPFLGYSSKKHMQQVVKAGERPPMDSSHTYHWPLSLQRLIVRCWSPFPYARPSFKEVVELLKKVSSETEPVPQPPAKESFLPKRRSGDSAIGGFGFLSPLAPRRKTKTTGSIGGDAKHLVGTSRNRSWGFAH